MTQPPSDFNDDPNQPQWQPPLADCDDLPASDLPVAEAEAVADTVGRIASGRLAGKSLPNAIWILATPVLLQNLMAAVVGLVDKLLAGRLAPEIVVESMDGLGVASYIGWFIGIAMGGLGIGGQALIARGIGSGDGAMAHRALGQAILLSMLWGLVVAVVMWLGAPMIASASGLDGQASEFCVQYIRILAYVMPLTGILMVGGMCMHGAGEAVWPLLVMVLVNVINVVLSWLFSGATIGQDFVSPLGWDLGVAGIALGTTIAYVFGGIFTLMVLKRGIRDLRLKSSDMDFDPLMLGRVARVGIPMFFEGLAMWTANLFILGFLGEIAIKQGEDGKPMEGLQGAHIIAVQWESFSFLPGFALGVAAGALAGQYLGAQNAAMAKRATIACVIIGAIIMCTLGVVFFFCGTMLTKLVSSEPVFLEYTPELLKIAGATQIFFAISMVIRQALRGCGDTLWTFLITTFSSYLVRLPAAWILGVAMGLGIQGVWYALCGEMAVRAVLFGARFLNGGWVKREL